MNLLHTFASYTDDGTYDSIKNTFKINVPQNFNFAYDVVDVYAQKQPQKRALVWCNDDGEEHIYTFADISRDSKKAALFLQKQGIKKGDKVMLILRRRYEFWWILLGLHRIGAIAIPATTQLLKKDLIYRTNAAGVKMIIAFDDSNIMHEIEKALPESPSVQTLVSISGKRDGWVDFHEAFDTYDATTFTRPLGDQDTTNEDPMLLYFTSGTSGYPKMVVHNFAYPLAHIVTAKFWQNVIDDGLHLSIAETGWAKAVWGKLYGQWIAGSAVFVYDLLAINPKTFFQKVADYGVTTFCAPPSAYRFLLSIDLSQFDLSKLQYCVTAGEALNPDVYNKFYEQTGLKMHEGYGQTETPVLAATFPGMEPKPGSMGKPAPNIDLEIIRPDGTRCEPNETGDIIIHLDNGKPTGVLSGYYNNAEESERAFQNGLYYTGDTAYYDEDGYIWFVGRNDDVIKSTGYRVSPFEVENVLQEHPSVLECAVTGIKDAKRGQVIKATIVLQKGFEATKELELQIKTFAKQNLAIYKIPRIIDFVSSLPKTISGKIQRAVIRKMDNC